MLLARVIGTVVATRKEPTLDGVKLLLLQRTDAKGQPEDAFVVAADAVGAGLGDLVLFAAGSSARQTTVTENRPVDAVVMAIVDLVEEQGAFQYRKDAE